MKNKKNIQIRSSNDSTREIETNLKEYFITLLGWLKETNKEVNVVKRKEKA